MRWYDTSLARLSTPAGEMVLTQSLTSGLTRRPIDPPTVFWGVGDRGPNIKPADAARRYGLSELAELDKFDGAKIMPWPGAGPSLARFHVEGEAVVLADVLPLRYPNGALLSGLPPDPISTAESEPIFGLDGARLECVTAGADTEGISARPDGCFWIAEEYGPSLLLVNDMGIIEQRVVPKGTGSQYENSPVPVHERLPAISTARKLNRGFEALAMSTDGRTLFAAFQSPLAHPDRQAHDQGTIVRIWALDPASGELRAEFAYPLDPPESFERDCEIGPVARNDVKVSELAALPDGSLLVLERVTLSTHIHRVRPDGASAVPCRYVDPNHRPSLEQLGQEDAARIGLALLNKVPVLSTDEHRAICGDLEGMLVLDDGSLLLANDSDYGIEGACTQFWLISTNLPPHAPAH